MKKTGSSIVNPDHWKEIGEKISRWYE